MQFRPELKNYFLKSIRITSNRGHCFGVVLRFFPPLARCFTCIALIPNVYGVVFTRLLLIWRGALHAGWYWGCVCAGRWQACAAAVARALVSLAFRRVVCPTLVGGGGLLWGINHGLALPDLRVHPGVY